ncbi:PAAR domain-containing protein [Polyangium jinanense]|uniref:PAAR domain-containing protein n=1 Tax=Polyangium jinanense TaxID=2829994 RepID=A0A9X3XA91_9BACT|nr:PAAR domain-containing protein [Polyangium jinanense]MDC3956484.1 PAAR domain-containing protein [Polyangium jinanense]MDC3985515.1 PAAR domain-containing protein [Polyangium jinanense]
MPQAARKGDLTVHGGVLAEGSPDVTIGGMPAARLTDKHVCPLHGPGPVTQTSFTVFINKVGAARVGDACTCMMPSTAVGGGDAAKPEQAKWTFKADGSATKENKYATEGEGTGKTLGEAWDQAKNKAGDKALDQVAHGRDPKDQAWKPKVALGANKELWSATTVPKGADGKPVDNYAQFFSGSTKGSIGATAEIENVRNMKANAGGKAEIEGSLFAAAGKAGDAKGWGEVSGEAKVLTAKADAAAGGQFEVKNGKVESAYVEAGAGAGASVVEGKASGKKTFTIPLVNLDVSIGGEASGALLTAEARASAYAGYRDGKLQMGFGAKVGALLAGLGFKLNIEIGPAEEKKEPPKAPGVPGVAGIDPIAIGCMTVLIGGTPPPYVPGAPPPDQPPGVIVDAVGIRNKSQALTLKAAKRAAAPFTPIKCDF